MTKTKLPYKFLFLALALASFNSFIAYMFCDNYLKGYDSFVYVESYSVNDLYRRLQLRNFFSDKTIEKCLMLPGESPRFGLQRFAGTNLLSIKYSSHDPIKNELCLNSVLIDVLKYNEKDDILRLEKAKALLAILRSSQLSLSLQNPSSLDSLVAHKNATIFSNSFIVKRDINSFLIIFSVFILSFVAAIYFYLSRKKIAKLVGF